MPVRVPAGPVAGTRAHVVGERVITIVDRSRRVRLPGRRPQPRKIVTVVRYPAAGAGGRDAPIAPGPWPLIVFGHGFSVTPATYAMLLQAWAAAGFVVAAPVFPRTNANAPGGPDEADIVNQPRDMSDVISVLLADAAAPGGWAHGALARGEIAVAGQSDGGETALAVAYDRFYRDPRVRAAVILSGAQIPGGSAQTLVAGPPLLAVQGTADTINLPVNTERFFAAARRPKFLLELLGAGHLPPYTNEQPQLGIVEQASEAFLARYLQHAPGALGRFERLARRPGVTELTARP